MEYLREEVHNYSQAKIYVALHLILIKIWTMNFSLCILGDRLSIHYLEMLFLEFMQSSIAEQQRRIKLINCLIQLKWL